MRFDRIAEQEDNKQQYLFRDDLRERVAVLESKLETSYREREELQAEIRALAEQTAAMRVEIDFLRKENEALRKQLKARDA
jgi:regulator of replication initiation timing